MAETRFPRIWFRDIRHFHYVYLPRVLFMLLGAAGGILYAQTVGIPISNFMYSAAGQGARYLPSVLTVMIPSIVMCSITIALLLAHIHKSKSFLAEELRVLTELAGCQDTLVSQDPVGLFERIINVSDELGFEQASLLPGKQFLAVRTQFYGLGSLDVFEARVAPERSVVIVARPLLPSRVSRTGYRRIIEQVKQRVG